mmetsp:Transcript_39544/g.60407  ORF Transcript_39544/g.60407 Transcript_39544/m.60407 type:complete len:81 (-) Transcript_39544:577-819(-)
MGNSEIANGLRRGLFSYEMAQYMGIKDRDMNFLEIAMAMDEYLNFNNNTVHDKELKRLILGYLVSGVDRDFDVQERSTIA